MMPNQRGGVPGVCLGAGLIVLGLAGLILGTIIPAVAPGLDVWTAIAGRGAAFDPGRMIADSFARLFLGLLSNLWWLLFAVGLLLLFVGAAVGGRRP